MLNWIHQIWETLQTGVESVEWSSEIDHVVLVSLRGQRQRVSDCFHSLLVGSSDSDGVVLQDASIQLATMEKRKRLMLPLTEQLWGWCGQKKKKTKTKKITLSSFVQVVAFFFLKFNVVSSFFTPSQKSKTCLISLIDFGKSRKWRCSPCVFVRARLWAIKWICGWNILFKIRHSRSNGVTV